MTELKAHKTMTPEEYAVIPMAGWHLVCRDYDGCGGTGIRLGAEADMAELGDLRNEIEQLREQSRLGDAAIDQLTKEREDYRMRWLGSMTTRDAQLIRDESEKLRIWQREARGWLASCLGFVTGEGPPNWDGIRAFLASSDEQSKEK